jgi:hypothetical protein
MKTNLAKQFFTAAAETSVSKSKHHIQMAKAHGTMLEECKKDSPEFAFHKTAKEQHESQSENWAALGETCVQCAKEAGPEMMSRKAAGMSDNDDEMMPPAAKGVTGDNPRFTAVLRPGQRALPAEDPTVAKILDGGQTT